MLLPDRERRAERKSMKKILILNGSPRVGGNSDTLIEPFVKGAKEAGNEVTRFDVARMNIHGCLGCCRGGKDPSSPCVQKDDMAKIYPAYREADLVVLVSPMYYWSMSGQLKCCFDRLFAVAECDPNYANPIKEAMVLMPSEGADEDNFEPVKAYYEALFRHLGWKGLAYFNAGGNMACGAIKEKADQLAAVYRLGKDIK